MKKIIANLIIWWKRNFQTISRQEAEGMGLQYLHGVYGDKINRLDCRSIWIDEKRRKYRVL